MNRSVRLSLFAAATLALAACGSDEGQAADSASTSATTEAAAPTPSTVGADLSALPVSTAELGDFPFVVLPQGFRQGDVSDRPLEQKYVFPAGGLLTVEGRYHHARVFAAPDDQWAETLLLRGLEDHIKTLGGVRIFDGALPGAAREKITADEPRFVADLYDPWPYRFRQYVIRTPESRIWIEIGYGYNAETIDLTVVEEAVDPA